MVHSLNSLLSGTVEPVVTQEHKTILMHYLAQSAQIGQQITQIILTSPDPSTLLSRTAHALGEFFQVDACLIVAGVNPTAMTQMGLWRADDYPALPSGYQAQQLAYKALTDDLVGAYSLAIPDIQASDTCEAMSWCSELLAAKTVLKIYTRFQSSVNGVIVLGRSQPLEWTIAQQEILRVVSESVAIAISQVQLTQQVQAATRHQSLFDQLSLAISSANELDEIFQIAIAGTAEALQVDRGLLLLLKYTEPLSETQASDPLPNTKVTVASEWLEPTAKERASTFLNEAFWLLESSLCQQAFRQVPEPLVIADGRDAPTVNLPTESLSTLDPVKMPAQIIVPLVRANNTTALVHNVLGFLVLQQSQPRFWQPDEIKLVKRVGTQVSSALIQNQSLRQAQALAEERAVQLQRSLEAQAKLYETTRQQMEQLQQLNQLKEEFMSSMSHELRTPLTKMNVAIQLLRRHPNLPSERRDTYMKILEDECNRESELIKDLLNLQRLESDPSQIEWQKIDLIRLIQDLAKSFEEKWADKRLTLLIDCPVRSQSAPGAQSLMIDSDYDSLERILLELLTNAGKYCDPDTTVTLRVTRQVQQSANQVVLTLTNTGPGISPTDLPYIFDRFHRGQGVTQKAVQGTGLGLALVKCLVQHLNGTINVKSDPSQNSQTSLTSFTVTLPQFQQQHPSLDR